MCNFNNNGFTLFTFIIIVRCDYFGGDFGVCFVDYTV